jgi:murein L,D-transpeptidase YcbB/YkuD
MSYRKIHLTALSLTAFVLLSFMECPLIFAEESAGGESSIDQILKEKIEKGKKIEGEDLHTLPMISSFYEGRGYMPLWSKNNRLTQQGLEMIKVIDEVCGEGLNPRSYHAEAVQSLQAGIEEKNGDEELSRIADLDLLLTDAFFSIGTHFSYGAINPYDMRMRWYPPAGEEELKTALDTAVKNKRVESTLKEMLPKTPEYEALKKKLYEFQSMAQDTKWTKIHALPKNKKINAGDRDERMPLIKERLGLVKNIGQVVPADALIYDEQTKQAVIKFQQERGLLDDGVIGFRTIDAMNVPIEDLIDKIKVNLDRERALSRILDQEEKIVVNIPAFWLTAYEAGRPVLEMKVITGMPKRKTPMLSSEIKHLIFSPKWFVPDTILFEDKLPHIRKDPAYLERHGMKVYQKGGGRVEAREIDWSQINSKHDIPYRVVQDSGDANALGRVKFIFPNRHDVYLHDTPQKSLFKNATRTFSSGCIRIEKPVELADLLLKDKADWNREKIVDAMNRSHEQVVPLTKPVPIHIIYLTAWVDYNGVMQFRDDVYGYDGSYRRTLCEGKKN